ncbi:MAG: hypothetical protein R3266_09735, partial [Gemmatimonadota bacterium]|nr:hypothetical protein [Gemmatimonadota bacterium]
PITSVGLGYRVDPVDGRSAGMGGTGIGLLGGTFSLRNPADLLSHDAPGFGLAFAGESVSLEGGDAEIDTGRERFTTIRALVPFGRWAVGLAFGGEFDQDWSARFQDTLTLEDGAVPFEEAREHDGGISAIDLSLARRIGPVSLGVSAQRLNGSLRKSFARTFDAPLGGAPVLANAEGAQTLAYRAWRFKAGAAITVADRFIVSGALGLPGILTVSSQTAEDPSAEIDIPATVEVGGSARISGSLLVTAAGGWGGWSDVGDLDGSISHDVTWAGAGLEWNSLQFLGGDLPLRLGARRAELPFSPAEEVLTEEALTGGLGWIFQQGRAGVDLAIEIGSRGDFASGGLEESFRRFTLSFTLRQQ